MSMKAYTILMQFIKLQFKKTHDPFKLSKFGVLQGVIIFQ